MSVLSSQQDLVVERVGPSTLKRLGQDCLEFKDVLGPASQ